MYLKGSKFNMNRRRRNSNPLTILLLVVIIGILFYVNQVVVPATPPLFIPTNTPTRAPESYVRDAEELASQGKFQPAIAAYKQAVQSDPRNATIFIALARLQVFMGNYQDAVNNAQNALLLNQNNSTAHAIRGWALGFLGNFLEAEAALEKAIALDGKNGIAYAYLAEVMALENQAGQDSLSTLEKATAASRTAQQLSPNTLETHRARGIVLEITSNYEEAAREFEAAIAINPNIADLHLSLGRNYRALQQYAKAIDEFNRANALNPNDPLPNTYISRTYATVGDYAKAIQYAQQAIKVSPQDPFLFGNLGTMYYRNKQYKEAISSLQLAVRGGNTAEGLAVKGLPLDYGRVAEYYYIYGLATARQNQCGEALQISQLLQQGVPNDETAVYNAKEIIKICQQWVEGTPTPTRAVTPSAATATKKP